MHELCAHELAIFQDLAGGSKKSDMAFVFLFRQEFLMLGGLFDTRVTFLKKFSIILSFFLVLLKQ